MLCVVAPERVDDVIAVCERWETRATPIGAVTDSDRMRILAGGEVVADLPVSILVDDCPLYDLEPAPPNPGAGPLYPAPPAVLTGAESAGETLLALLSSSNIVSRRPVFEQYDPVVQAPGAGPRGRPGVADGRGDRGRDRWQRPPGRL
jgi:phosphoribosylformylglycinamidine (FGAM) synthase-like enzyme